MRIISISEEKKNKSNFFIILVNWLRKMRGKEPSFCVQHSLCQKSKIPPSRLCCLIRKLEMSIVIVLRTFSI